MFTNSARSTAGVIWPDVLSGKLLLKLDDKADLVNTLIFLK
jgi:hypothetical protein